jgi:hypothetical protein
MVTVMVSPGSPWCWLVLSLIMQYTAVGGVGIVTIQPGMRLALLATRVAPGVD